MRRAASPVLGHAAFLATGAALVVHVLFDVELAVATALNVAVGGGVLVALLPRLGLTSRRLLRAAFSAAAALVAYDVSRSLLVAAGLVGVSPFAALPHFGRALLGESASPTAALLAGSAFHAANGLGFGVAYALTLPDRGVWGGIVWGLLLEACMLLVYPTWLGVDLRGEFLSLSLLGHLAYGSVLGWSARRLLAGSRPA